VANQEIDSDVKIEEGDINYTDQEIDESKKEMEQKVNEFGDKVNEFDNNVKKLDTEINNYKNFLSKYIKKLKWLLIILAVVTVIAFWIATILLKLLFIATYPAIITSIVIAFSIFSLFVYVAYDKISGIELPSTFKENSGIIDRSTKIDYIRNEVSKGAGLILYIGRELSNKVNMVLEEKEKQNRWKALSESLKNAIERYGLKAAHIKQGFEIWSNDPSTWLNNLTNKIAKDTSINVSIIRLSYYDYIEDTEMLKNTWIEIRSNKNILKELILNLLKKKYSKEFGESMVNEANIEAIARLISDNETFSIEQFDELIHSIYNDLFKRKVRILEKLRRFGFPFVNDDRFTTTILRFIPKEKDNKLWNEEFVKIIGEETGIDATLIDLFISSDEGIGQEHCSLEKIKQDKTLLMKLTNILINNQLVNVPTDYIGNNNINIILSNVIKDLHTFDIEDISKSFDEKLNNIGIIKKLFIKIMNDYLPVLDVGQDFSKFLPSGEPVDSIADYLSKTYNIGKEALLLLYYEYIGDRHNLNLVFDEIIKEPIKTRSLAEAILSTNAITLPEGISKGSALDSISALLQVYKKSNLYNEFNIHQIAIDLPYFYYFLEHSKGISRFLFNEGITNTEVDVPQNKLSELFNIHTKQETFENKMYENIKALCEYMLETNKPVSFKSQQIGPIAVAILSIYLTDKEGEMLSRYACSEAGRFDLSSKILYQYIKLKEELRNYENKPKLIEIIQNTINGQYSDYSQIESFKVELKNGILPETISGLIGSKFRELSDKLGGIELKFKEIKSEKLTKSLHEFLNTKLKESAISQSIESNIFSAYLISSSGGKAFNYLDRYLNKALEALDNNDKQYSQNIILSNEEKNVAGRGTRVGVVPPNKNFDRVMEQLKEVLKKVVELSEDRKPVGYTIVKIVPSQNTFQRLTLNTNKKYDPFTKIKELLIERFPLVTMGLVAVNDSKQSGQIVLVDLIKEFFNTQTDLSTLLENAISKNDGSILDKFYKKTNKKLDEYLFIRYNVSTLCEFSIEIYKKSKSKSEQEVEEQLARDITEIFKDAEIQLKGDQISSLAKQIFAKMENIATILQFS